MKTKELINFLLKSLAISIADSKVMQETAAKCQNSDIPFNAKYYLEKAAEESSEVQLKLWQSLGSACNYDLRVIFDVIDEIVSDNGKEVEDAD